MRRRSLSPEKHLIKFESTKPLKNKTQVRGHPHGQRARACGARGAAAAQHPVLEEAHELCLELSAEQYDLACSIVVRARRVWCV